MTYRNKILFVNFWSFAIHMAWISISYFQIAFKLDWRIHVALIHSNYSILFDVSLLTTWFWRTTCVWSHKTLSCKGAKRLNWDTLLSIVTFVSFVSLRNFSQQKKDGPNRGILFFTAAYSTITDSGNGCRIAIFVFVFW
jgi:hypothetical protein